ncbi:MAG: ATP-binding protein [Vicinamibacterales bacterium]
MKAKRQIDARVSTVAAAPRAAMLIESMRDIGYSLESALADIVDNSITAGASTVRLFAQVNATSPRIAIVDDGQGMTRAELLDAMRPGSRSPLETRESNDLGRFGLGLKTASFSQCRRLTVVSRRDGTVSAARWDLDFVAEVNDWLLEVPEEPLEIQWTDRIGPHGTLVLWEQLDRLTDSGSPEEVQRHFIRRLDEAREHLELVFHRFLTGEKRLRKLAVALNERPLVPFDPFHTAQSEAGPIERISQDVSGQAFTLPHHSKVPADDWESTQGRPGIPVIRAST